jgi:hypothetical protein
MDGHYQGYENYREHWLFRAVRSAVMRRAGNVCEQCGKRAATEVHHLKYPLWGTFDTPSNLKALCHECHCEAHDKAR